MVEGGGLKLNDNVKSVLQTGLGKKKGLNLWFNIPLSTSSDLTVRRIMIKVNYSVIIWVISFPYKKTTKVIDYFDLSKGMQHFNTVKYLSN